MPVVWFLGNWIERFKPSMRVGGGGMLMCAYVYINVIFNAYYWESLEKNILFKEATGTLSKD